MGRFAVLVAAIGALGLAAPAASSADCCMGWVYTYVSPKTVLAPSVSMRIFGDDPDHHYDARITPYLIVGYRRIALLPRFAVSDVGPQAQRHVLHVPPDAIARAARYGKRTHHRRAVLELVMSHVVDIATGNPVPAYAMDSFLRLPTTAR